MVQEESPDLIFKTEVNVDAWLSEAVDINAMERAAAEAQEAVAEEDTFEEFE